MTQQIFTANSFSIIFITVPTIDEARLIAKTLVEERLAACVSVIPEIISTYRWEGKVEEYAEAKLMVKTKSELFSEVAERVKKMHSATLPEIISVNLEQGTEDYKNWIFEELEQIL